MTNETVGKKAIDLQKNQDMQSDWIELQKEIHKGSNSKKSYEEEIWDCVDRARKDSSISKDFYIVVLFKKERLLHNVVRQYFFYRQSCPTPEYDQTVYKYHRKDDELEFLWVVPNNAACISLPFQKQDLPQDQMWLLEMIEKFTTGKLDLLAQKLNKELDKN